jgi:putative acetyltransferase
MTICMSNIRAEAPADHDAIHDVIVSAFLGARRGSHTEQFIVRALRAGGELTVSLVAELGGRVVGHVAVSPVKISGTHVDWFGLGPISVLPACQGRGIGAMLLEAALSALRGRGAQGCVVLGNPAYYNRFGFRAEPGLVLPDVAADHFMAIAFRGQVPSGVVAYSEAFNAVA